jgi:GTP:adenosylcobinamide-phosphate guanylyltransferase
MLAVVAAGGEAQEGLKSHGIQRVPLVMVDGETLLSRTCRCLAEGGGCDLVVVLAPEDVPLPEHPAVKRGSYSGAIVDDVINCVQAVDGAEHLVISGADMPLLTPKSVGTLVDLGLKHRPDVLYPVVDRDVVEACIPGSPRTYLKLRGLAVTGGNIFWVNRKWLTAHAELLRRLFNSRKNLLKLMGMFGLWFFLKLLTGQADLAYLEAHLGRVVHGRIKAALVPCPDLAIDLDKESDLEPLSRYLDPLPEA